jgi:hypothetical protein
VERCGATIQKLWPGMSHRDGEALFRACLSEIEAAGMVIVPREPTEEMLSEADSAIPRAEPDATGFRMMGREVALAAWNAAIAASPKKG